MIRPRSALPASRASTWRSNLLPDAGGTTSPNVFIKPRIWFDSSVPIRTRRVRAATNVRASMLSKLLTRTSL